MTFETLNEIVVEARRGAHAVKAEGLPDDGLFRAWERLADAADALHAMMTRRELYESAPEPGTIAR